MSSAGAMGDEDDEVEAAAAAASLGGTALHAAGVAVLLASRTTGGEMYREMYTRKKVTEAAGVGVASASVADASDAGDPAGGLRGGYTSPFADTH